ncbi:MAG TPA: BTAD domain-containing putative transcriptional regulator, partial [Anaerolineae bacterium]|nr:BTAD domain-containing putative transcriptional regulator [Anaerolineae bacterium]
MARLSIALLGHPRVTVDGAPAAFPTNKVQALLAYLAVEADHAHSREVLTGLLWPNQPEEAARVNLRASLYRLRQAIHDRDAAAFLRLTRDTVQFKPDSAHWLDVRMFQAWFRACEEHDRDRPETCPACHERLAQAAEIYRGDFLAGFSLSDSAAFDDWVLLTREMLRRQALEVLARLAEYHDQRGDYGLARKYALRQVEIEPWRELAYRQLMRALALSRQPNAALAQYERCREVLLAELGVGPEPETAALAAQIRAGDFDQIRREPAIASSSPSNHNLPVPLTRFVGRERELADVRHLLATTHLLTLTGIGGVGKTRLALQVAADLIGDFAHGVWLVELAPVSDATRVPHAVASALAVGEEARRPLLDTLSDYLRAKELLLVLDNCEHLIDACAQLVERLLRVAPNLRIIATSREALRLAGETTRPVPPLQTPILSQVNHIPISELIQYEAMRLFVDRAVSVKSDFAITLANASLVAHVCDRLDGIPLAIELAAARVNALSVEQIAVRLDDRFRRLAGASRITLPSHQTLSGLIDWSYDSL